MQCDKEDEEDNENYAEERNAIPATNCTDDHEFIKHDNDFLDRKMAQYALMSQIKDIPPIQPLMPNRTFELFNRMIRISNRFCPDHFVPNIWVNHIMELFYVLHKGREFKYDEALSPQEFTWIKEILDRCEEKGYEIDLITDPNAPQAEKDEFGDLKCVGDTEKVGNLSISVHASYLIRRRMWVA